MKGDVKKPDVKATMWHILVQEVMIALDGWREPLVGREKETRLPAVRNQNGGHCMMALVKRSMQSYRPCGIRDCLVQLYRNRKPDPVQEEVRIPSYDVDVEPNDTVRIHLLPQQQGRIVSRQRWQLKYPTLWTSDVG